MIRIGFTLRANPDSRYQPGAFAGSIGKELNIELPEGRATGLLRAAEVVDEGSAVALLLECGETTARLIQRYKAGHALAEAYDMTLPGRAA